jgi:hypothetical protein
MPPPLNSAWQRVQNPLSRGRPCAFPLPARSLPARSLNDGADPEPDVDAIDLGRGGAISYRLTENTTSECGVIVILTSLYL